MANGKNAISRWLLSGAITNAPKNWQTSEVLATFDNENIQASITIDKFTFIGAEATAILAHIASGMTGGVGITEGIPYKVELYNNTGQIVVFDGMINLAEGLEINDFAHEVTASLKLKDQLFNLEEKLQSLSFGYLTEALSLFTTSDYTTIEYVVQKKTNTLEVIIMSIAIYMLTKELIDTIIKITNQITDIIALVAIYPAGFVGGLIKAIVFIIINILYAAMLLTAMVKLASTMISQLVPVKRKGKALNFRTALARVCTHLGYGFNSNIIDLSSVYYLPSNFNFDGTDTLGIVNNWVGNKKGIPATSDYGYNCAEFFELAKKLFNGKFAIINGVVNFHNVDDVYWSQYSTYVLPSIREKIRTQNLDELIANRYLTFDVDFSDEWTIDDYAGTSFEVITNQQTTNDIKLVSIKGLDEIRLGACLGSRKSQISGIENFIHNIASTLDGIISTLGGQATFVNMLGSSIGLMKISTNNWAKPKVLKVDDNKRLVARTNWGARYIYETYYKGRSFVSNINGLPYYGQKEVYRNVRVPFGLNDLLLLVQNSCLNLPDGSIGRVISCKYRFNNDTAVIDYFIRKPYTANLVETYVEPTNQ